MAVRIYKRHYLLYLRCSIHRSVYCRKDYDLLVLIRCSIRLVRVFPAADLVLAVVYEYVVDLVIFRHPKLCRSRERITIKFNRVIFSIDVIAVLRIEDILSLQRFVGILINVLHDVGLIRRAEGHREGYFRILSSVDDRSCRACRILRIPCARRLVIAGCRHCLRNVFRRQRVASVLCPVAVRIYKRHYLLYLRCSIHCSVDRCKDYCSLVFVRDIIIIDIFFIINDSICISIIRYH